MINKKELLDVLKEVREQLGWLNSTDVKASTNVILKRLDDCIYKISLTKETE